MTEQHQKTLKSGVVHPNRLTFARIALLPFFMIFLSYPESKTSTITACLVFVAGMITDFLDGYIAKKHHMVTTLGKFLDPIADKMLVCSALIILSSQGKVPVWLTCLLTCREILVSGLRMVAAEKSVVIAASKTGKYKTALQMGGILFIILPFSGLTSAGMAMLWLSLIFSLWSGMAYVSITLRTIETGGP